VLCNVDFSGANLRSASFWAVTLDDETKKTLKNTAWWQAVGWPWSEIEGIAHTSEGDEAQTARLKASAGFAVDIQHAIDSLQIAAVNTPERALALNDIAWTRAIWGVDVSERSALPTDAPSQSSRSDPCVAEEVPANARDAAEGAVCIISKMNVEGEKKGAYNELLAKFQDTLAYILMQSGQMSKALETFEEIRRENPAFFESGGALFRYAIAQYVAGQDKAVALEHLNTALVKKRYQPTHELQTLRNSIFTSKEFAEPLKASIEKLWPPVPNQTACPASKSTTRQ
jgi:tetratricopeptide (TPR) repeat protein